MITLRPATPGDTTSLAALAVQTFNETFPGLYAPQDLQAHMQTYSSPEYFARRLKTDSILLAMDGGEMIGYAKFGAVGLPVRHAPDAAEIHR